MKYADGEAQVDEAHVAPHWGAWIEILRMGLPRPERNSRTPLGCVD